MIFLTEGNIPLNAAYADEIVQIDRNTYQLTFKFPTNNILWQRLKEETFLIADDLHGEQDFVIFEVEKKHGYIQVYANQVMTLLNNYVVNPISLDRQTGSTALSRFAGSITRSNPFSFFSNIEDRHTFNIDSKNAMDAFAKDKHSILGLWGGDLLRHGYQVRLLKNGGSENESLFMYQKNLSSYEHKTSTKSLRTRITFITTIRGEGEKPVDKHYKVVVDSPLINKYSQIYEDVVEVNDQDVVDEATLLKYGKQYFRTTLCDMLEDSIEIDVVGQSDVPVQMYDVVSVYHEQFDLDVRKKITKYNYSPMAKKLKSIGFGDFKSGLANAIGNAVSDAVKNETQHLQGQFATQLAKEIKNADLDFDRKKEELVNQFTDGLNAAKARAEEVKRQLSDTIDQRFSSFDNGPLQEVKRKADEALRSSGASSLLAQEAKQISEQFRANITNLQTSSQNALNQIESFKTQYGTKLNEVKSTADGLFTKMGAVETYINKDGQRQESLQRYARDESARQVSAVREQISREYVGKSSYHEDVRGLERRFSAISTQTNNDIATKIVQYKQTVDGQFASITSQISGKANQSDFQQVRETSQLYERIIGRSESDIADKVARMALTNQLFQVEVAKASAGGRNYIRGIKEMRVASGSWDSGTFRSSGSGSIRTIDVSGSPAPGFNKAIRIISSDPKSIIGIAQDEFEIVRGTYTMSVWVKGTAGQRVRIQNYWSSDDSTGISPEFVLKDDKWTYLTFSSERKKVGKLSIGYVYLLNGAKGSYIDVLAPQLEEGSVATSARPALEDTDEAIRTFQNQLAGSWAVQNLNSAGSIISQINATNNQILIEAEKIRLKGKTLLDELTAIDGYFKRLFVGEGNFAKLNAEIIGANTITADKMVMDQAFFNKLVANEAYLNQLFAKQAFINRVQSVAIDASQVRSGILSGDRIYGGTIRGANIFGGTLTGHTKIQLGSYGSFDALDGGLQINVPRDYNAKDGLGVQFIGSYGRGDNVPYGLFIYKDSDFTTGGYASKSDDFLLTVEGYIKAKGIGWLKCGKSSIDGSTTGNISYWNSNNVSLDFGGSGNDIYYSYNGKAYSLWSVVNQHFSDRRLKENIVDCKYKALDFINQFQFKEYDWKKQEDRPQQAHTKIGLIAQEVQEVDPTLVYESGDTLNLDNLRLTNIALKAIQELALENKILIHRLEKLENEYRTA